MQANPYRVILGMIAFVLPVTGLTVIETFALVTLTFALIGGMALVALLVLKAQAYVPKPPPAVDPVYEEQKRRERDPNA